MNSPESQAKLWFGIFVDVWGLKFVGTHSWTYRLDTMPKEVSNQIDASPVCHGMDDPWKTMFHCTATTNPVRSTERYSRKIGMLCGPQHNRRSWSNCFFCYKTLAARRSHGGPLCLWDGMMARNGLLQVCIFKTQFSLVSSKKCYDTNMFAGDSELDWNGFHFWHLSYSQLTSGFPFDTGQTGQKIRCIIFVEQVSFSDQPAWDMLWLCWCHHTQILRQRGGSTKRKNNRDVGVFQNRGTSESSKTKLFEYWNPWYPF